MVASGPTLGGVPNLDLGEIVLWIASSALQIAAGIASYRRSRCLSRFPVWKSIAIGLLAYGFTFIWFLYWLSNRDKIAAEWDVYRLERERQKVIGG